MKKFAVFVVIASFAFLSCATKQIDIAEPCAVFKAEEPVIEVKKQTVKMVNIKAGSFFTEKNNGSDIVINVNSFYLGIYTVTQKEYQEVMMVNPSFFKGDDLPVENVSWVDTVKFCNSLSRQEGLTPVYQIEENKITWNKGANGYRLPTDNEWEYACRAGTTTSFNTGNTISSNQANYDGRFPYNSNTRGEYRVKTTPVGTFAPNAWGLFDMHGNLWEWCWDDRIEAIIETEFPQNETYVLSASTIRVIRGGAWSSSGVSIQSSYRSGYHPYYKSNTVGFRIARNAQ